MELDVTWQRLVRIWWAWLWRSLLATALAAVLTYLSGLWIGFLAGLLKLPIELATLLSTVAAFIIAVGLSIFPLWQVLSRDFGEFRLILQAKRQA